MISFFSSSGCVTVLSEFLTSKKNLEKKYLVNLKMSRMIKFNRFAVMQAIREADQTDQNAT